MSKQTRQDKTSQSAHFSRGILLFVLGTLLTLALIDYNFHQPEFQISSSQAIPRDEFNAIGLLGAKMSFYLTKFFGLTSWIIALSMLWIAYISFTPATRNLTKKRGFACVSLIFSSAALLENIQQFLPSGMFVNIAQNYYYSGLGGDVGQLIYCYFFNPYLGTFGSTILLLTIAIISSIIFLTKRESLNAALSAKIAKLGMVRGILTYFSKKIFDLAKKILSIIFWLASQFSQNIFKFLQTKWHNRKLKEPGINVVDTPYEKIQHKEHKPKLEKQVEKADKSLPIKSQNGYIFPTLDLLQKAKKLSGESDNHKETMIALVNSLKEFGINVTPGDVFSGPVITRYEITPAPGVRVEKIVNLDKNIALNLRAESVRILAPVPGRGCVGVELPNKSPQMVCLREILESQNWADMKADIPIVLGRGATGEPMINDLAKMPHLLIAGSTGSGKTVCINAIIASLVYHSSPKDLRFIMVDPKIVEMQVFNDLPHMLIPVLTDPKKVPNALKWLICEMEHRYKIFAKANVRNIASFNAKILKNIEEPNKAAELDRNLSAEERSAVSNISARDMRGVEIPSEKLPYIVCVIDELADLMMVSPADIETSVARLAQLARAAGIHLILATQRPSVNVITGIIKANLPSRIAFKVASKVDSRTILDIGGADALLGRGDMLFQPPGASGLVRAQGALVSDDEINNIVQFLNSKNGAPEYAMDIHDAIESFEDSDVKDDNQWDDELIPQAIEILRTCDKPSTSMLQRRLKIGYNRAARMMESLEELGYISPGNDRNFREKID